MNQPEHISAALDRALLRLAKRRRSAGVGLSGGSDSERNLAERPGDVRLSRGQVSEWGPAPGKSAGAGEVDS